MFALRRPFWSHVCLLGIPIGEQPIRVAKQLVAGETLAAWRQARCTAHMFSIATPMW